MAVLSDSDRATIWAEWMRENNEPLSINKSDLRAVFNALDDYMVTNATVINSSIPQPGRSALSQNQKAWILQKVIEKRWRTGA